MANQIDQGTGGDFSSMPTFQDWQGDSSTKQRVKGTDKWNNLIAKISQEEGIDPVFVKAIMTQESSGNLSATNGNTNGTKDYGLMQVNSSWGSQFDYQRMLNDAEYAIRSGIDVIKIKMEDAVRAGEEPTAFNVYWRYNGKSEQGRRNTLKFMKIYEGFPDRSKDRKINMYEAYGFTYNKSTNVGSGASLDSAAHTLLNRNHPSMVRGVAPSVEDDTYPEHRYASNPFVLRIGDSQFYLPPSSISTTKATMVADKHVVRAKTPAMTKSGYTTQRLDIRMVFADSDHINGWKVPAPGGKEYYMDGLRALLAQFYRNPFLPIRNEYVNDRLSIYNVALSNVHIQTDPEFPSLLVVDLSFLECTMEPFLALPDYMYDMLINYPLWRWYYQQMLHDDANERYSGTYLRPVPKHFTGDTFFKVLSKDAIEGMKDSVIEKARERAKDTGETTYVNPQFALANVQIEDLQSIMEEWRIDDLITENVQLQIGKTMTPIHMDDFETPAFQDMGGVQKIFTMEFHCQSRDHLQSLQTMVSHSEEMARDYRHRFVGGFIAIHNEIINMAGIEYAMVLDMQTATVEGHPDEYKVVMTFQEFNPNQKNQERLNGVNFKSTELSHLFDERSEVIDKGNQKPSIVYEAHMEKVFSAFELYPDLELPTHEIANRAVKDINAFREKQGLQLMPFTELPRGEEDIWVEPDFYMCYPNIQEAYKMINAGDFGAKMVNLMMDGTYEDIAANTDGIQWNEKFSALSKNFKDNSANPYEEQSKYKQTAEMSINYDLAQQDYMVTAFQDWDEDNEIPPVMDIASMMLHDYFKYDIRFRLVRAFPTYMLLFVDEGQWVDGKRLFNNYYAYHSIHQIDIAKDKDNPVDLAYISISNTYGTFNHSSKLYDPRESYDEGIWDKAKKLFGAFFHFTLDDKLIDEHAELMDYAKLRAGARIHLRMGYSSNTRNLPITFNGQIASVNDGPDIDMVCQGDGAELISMPLSTNPNAGSPNEPHNVFMKYLPARQSNYWFGASSEFEFMNNYESRYGIEHFGFVESTADQNKEGSDKWGVQFWQDKLKYITPKDFEDVSDSVAEFAGGFFDGIIVDNASWISSKITGHPNFVVYDIMKNIYRGTHQPHTGVINYGHFDMWGSDNNWKDIPEQIKRVNMFDGEKNVNFSTYNQTLWDIGQKLSMFVPEFICAPHYHGLRSTLFFGQPHWPVKYQYLQKPGTEGTIVDDYGELYKPFQQLHIFNSGHDIINNNIKASSEHIKHIATGVYMRGSTSTVVEGLTVYADRSIMAHYQKQMIVDTGVYQDIFGHDLTHEIVTKYGAKPVADFFMGLPLLVGEGVVALEKKLPWEWAQKDAEWTEENILKDMREDVQDVSDFMENWARPGYIAAQSVTIGALQRNFTQMYQGDLTIFGTASVKPWDLFTLQDNYKDMTGTIQVGKVTHSFSRSTGFLTTIKPDLLVSRIDGPNGRSQMIHYAMFAGTSISILVARKILLSKLFRTMARKGLLAGAATTKAGAKLITKFGSKVFGDKVTQTATKTLEKIAKNGGKAKAASKTALNLLKSNIATMIMFGAATEYFMTWYDKQTKYNNVIYIYPLWKMGKPYVAGIKGGMHIIPGYIDADMTLKDVGKTDRVYKFDENGNVVGEGDSDINYHDPADIKGKVMHPFGFKARITSNFGWRILNGSNDYHSGVDLVPVGDKKGRKDKTEVFCIADGTIIRKKKGHNGGAGNYVEVHHKIDGRDYITAYLHLEEILASGNTGDRIKKGDIIGYMGGTGGVPVHLHFEVAEGTNRNFDEPKFRGDSSSNNRVDPVKWLKKMGVEVE